MSPKHRPLVIEIKPTDPAPTLRMHLSSMMTYPLCPKALCKDRRAYMDMACNAFGVIIFHLYVNSTLGFRLGLMARNDSVGWIFLGLLGTTFTVMVIAIAAEILAIVRA